MFVSHVRLSQLKWSKIFQNFPCYHFAQFAARIPKISIAIYKLSGNRWQCFLRGCILAGCGYVALYFDSVGVSGHMVLYYLLYQLLVLPLRIVMPTCNRK